MQTAIDKKLYMKEWYKNNKEKAHAIARKYRQSEKAKINPYQLISTFTINSVEQAIELFPIFSLLRSQTDIDSDTSIIYWFFDVNQQPLTMTYNWTTQELSLTFSYRVFRRCQIHGNTYLDEL